MSAFQVAFEVLRRVTNDVAADEILTNLLNEHAHELAEKIREFIGPESYPHETDQLVLRYVKGWRNAADLIDPKEKP